MPIVGIPSLLRHLTNGQRTLSAEGDTVRQIIDDLDKRYPGIRERLCVEDRLRPSIAVLVDGHMSALGLRHRLEESSEVHFVISISGGES